MRPLRVAHLVTGLVAGGAQLQALALAERLPRDRFQVEFLAIGGDGPYDARAKAADIRVVHLGSRTTADESRVAGHQRRLRTAQNYVRATRGHYDIVDAWLYPNDMQAALMRILTGTPVIMAGRRNIQAHYRFGPLGGVVDRVVDRMTDAVVANSAAVAAFAQQSHHTHPDKLHIIRNGVAPIAPISADQRAEMRERIGVGGDDIVIGCIGRYNRIKGHDLLIDAFSKVVPDRPRLRLVLIGDGDLRPELERQISSLGLDDRVLLHGMELDPRPMYGALDLVVQASRSEGLPNALLEAASAGCAIVATAAGGSAEIVVDGVTGILVPVEDVDALTAAIGRAVDDGRLRGQLGQAARAHIEATFGMERYVREYGDLYESMAAAKAVRR